MNVRDAFFAVLLGSLAALSWFVVRPFVTYVLGAGLLAFVLLPAQRRLGPRIGERPAALSLVALAVAATTIPFVLLSVHLFPDAAETTEEVTRRPVLGQIERIAGEVGVEVDLGGAQAVSRQLLDLLVGNLSEVLGTTVRAVIGLSILVFVLYYLLVDGPALVRWIRDVTPLSTDVQDQLYGETYRVTWAVLKGHVFVGVVQGVLGGIGLFVAGVPDAFFWTVVMVLLSFVPVLGVGLVWVPASAYLLFAGQLPSGIFLLVYGATVVSWVDNYLRAYVVDMGSGLHPAVVLVGVLGGVYFMGALGLFLGPVILAVFKATVVVADDFYGL